MLIISLEYYVWIFACFLIKHSIVSNLAEKKKKHDWKASAAKELEEWYAQRDATLKGTWEANRKAEEEHLAAFGREQGESVRWDEIAKLCEAKAKNGGINLSRLKSLLLHLKEHHKK